ncbi:hypothetical protein F5884DRAFT_462933 [Xylogone sp. PMI_703]|nr:hypothetical protein F5884DRAFT_462933 [Xylogone sp. PMI_703]
MASAWDSWKPRLLRIQYIHRTPYTIHHTPDTRVEHWHWVVQYSTVQSGRVSRREQLRFLHHVEVTVASPGLSGLPGPQVFPALPAPSTIHCHGWPRESTGQTLGAATLRCLLAGHASREIIHSSGRVWSVRDTRGSGPRDHDFSAFLCCFSVWPRYCVDAEGVGRWEVGERPALARHQFRHPCRCRRRGLCCCIGHGHPLIGCRGPSAIARQRGLFAGSVASRVRRGKRQGVMGNLLRPLPLRGVTFCFSC